MYSLLQHLVQDSASGRRKMPNGKPLSQGVLSNYRHALAVVANFDDQQGQPTQIMLAWRPTKALQQRQCTQAKKWQRHFIRYLCTRRGYTDQMVNNVCKVLKTALNYARQQLGLPIGDCFQLLHAPQVPVPAVVLLPEQLAYLIYNDAFHHGLPPHLQRSKDMFVFGCTTGLRFGDLLRLKKHYLQQAEGRCYLHLHTQKTATAVHIPLPQYCMDIIGRLHNGKRQQLFAPISLTNFNLHLKAIGRLAGWQQPLPKYRCYQGRLREIKNKAGKTWLFHEHLSAHTMRRTAITTLLMLGVEEQVVRQISGHAPGSREFYRYVALAQSYMDQQVAQAYARLSENPGWYRQPRG